MTLEEAFIRGCRSIVRELEDSPKSAFSALKRSIEAYDEAKAEEQNEEAGRKA